MINKMKEKYFALLPIIILFLASTAAFASNPVDDDKLYVYTNQSVSPAIHSLDDIDKITFSSKSVIFWEAGRPTEYSNVRLIVLKRSDISSEINRVIAGRNGITINYNRKNEMVLVRSDKPLSGVTIYDVYGHLVAVDDNKKNDYEVSLSSVPRGIYVVKVNGGSVSQKIAK